MSCVTDFHTDFPFREVPFNAATGEERGTSFSHPRRATLTWLHDCAGRTFWTDVGRTTGRRTLCGFPSRLDAMGRSRHDGKFDFVPVERPGKTRIDSQLRRGTDARARFAPCPRVDRRGSVPPPLSKRISVVAPPQRRPRRDFRRDLHADVIHAA